MIRVEVAEGRAALTEFLEFHDRVYASRDVFRPEFQLLLLPVLEGGSPFCAERRMRAFVAREGGQIAARALAVLDARYNRHWDERLGHVVWFEAMPASRDATRALMDSACEWLAAGGAEAARAGMGLFEFPFVIDDYESLPPIGVRYNPPYYHSLLKDAGFETEQGWVDYKIEVHPELVARWEGGLEAARRAGFEIVPLRDVEPAKRIREFTATHNETFRSHWGFTPFRDEELGLLLDLQAPLGALDTSLLAYRDGEPLGMLWVAPETSAFATYRPGRVLRESEKLNFLGIGVREKARGRGVNLAMAAYSYLELVRRGAKFLSYTLVLDDNWPSRRTAEKLGAFVCADYVTYRRNFRR